jgi:hypothetical protein
MDGGSRPKIAGLSCWNASSCKSDKHATSHTNLPLGWPRERKSRWMGSWSKQNRQSTCPCRLKLSDFTHLEVHDSAFHRRLCRKSSDQKHNQLPINDSRILDDDPSTYHRHSSLLRWRSGLDHHRWCLRLLYLFQDWSKQSNRLYPRSLQRYEDGASPEDPADVHERPYYPLCSLSWRHSPPVDALVNMTRLK